MKNRISALTKSFSAQKTQKTISNLLKPVLISMIIVLSGTGFVIAAEIDDSGIFLEAFTAYRSENYQLAIQKISILNQLFPDTPLRDVALLLMARSGLKTGNNELAAKSIEQFTREFPKHPYTSVSGNEDNQQGQAAIQKLRENYSSNLPLNSESLKSRNDQASLTNNTITDLKDGRLTSAVNATNEIRTAINISGGEQILEIGRKGLIPFQVANIGRRDEVFFLELNAPAEYVAQLTENGAIAIQPAKVTIKRASQFKGAISLQMPPDKPDGHKDIFSLRVTSANSANIVQTYNIPIFAAAPLVRVVARPLTTKPARGEQLQYRVTVLNAGTVPDRDLTVRVSLPEEIRFLDAPGVAYSRESLNTIVFRIPTLETGKIIEFTMNVKISENSTIGQELRSRIELVHEKQLLKEVFNSLAAVVRE